METAQVKSRIYGLDIMRAVAITYVMFSHGYTYSGSVVSAGYYRWLILDGVGLFFVLSGFLVGGILIRKIGAEPFGIKQLFGFYMGRWLRTLPLYFCVLTFLIGCYYISHHSLPPAWPRYYVFLQNFASPHPVFFLEAWSLSVEEWFYVLVPLSLFFLLKLSRQKKWLILSCIIVVLLSVTAIRLYKVEEYDYYAAGNFGEQVLKVVITRMDSIMYGVLGAWFSYYYTSGFYRHKTVLFFAGIISLIGCNILFSPFFVTRLHYTLVPLATVCLLPALSALKEGKGTVYKCVTFISLISYSMYLCNHMIVQRGLMPFVTSWLNLDLNGNTVHSGITWCLFWLLSIGIAYTLHRIIEKPFMNLREKLKD